MVTVWDEDFSSGLECGGVNSFKIDDDGEVTDFENNDNENNFNFIFFQSFRTQSFISGFVRYRLHISSKKNWADFCQELAN